MQPWMPSCKPTLTSSITPRLALAQDDKSVNIIQFHTPITVIVGYNGSGKTSM